MNDGGVSARSTGQYPLSIATSRAIESACGIHPDIRVNRPPLVGYQELWINCKTLFRNLMGALDKETYSGIPPEQIANALKEEMDMIPTITREVAPLVKVRYYINELIGLEALYPGARLRVENTPKQKEFRILQDTVLEGFLDHAEQLGISLYVRTITPELPTKSLMLTHMPFDLLSRKHFADLDLVESHTGAIKKYAQFYTKFFDGKNLPMIPFREDMLQIFGDKETFQPLQSRFRRATVELALKDRWTPVTTTDKIKFGVKTLDPETKALMQRIMA